MAKIYSGMEGVKIPEYSQYQDFDRYNKACEAYDRRIKTTARRLNRCPEAGEEITFPVADGYARYVVVSLKPVVLIHISTGDAYSFEYANRLTAADIRDRIKRSKALEKLFTGGGVK